MADQNVTVKKLPSGKWACFLHLASHPEPIHLGRDFKSEEHAENWLSVSEAMTAIDVATQKYQK